MRERIKAISTVEELIDRGLYEEWDEITDPFEKTQLQILIKNRAKELRCLPEINSIFKTIGKIKGGFKYAGDDTPWIVETGKGRSVNAGLLAEHLTNMLQYFVLRRDFDERDDLYIYNAEKGIYEFCNKNAFKARTAICIPIELQSNSLLDNVYGLFMSSPDLKVLQAEDINSNEKYINVQNGLYNIFTGELEQHRPEVYSTIQMNCSYRPDAVAPLFEKYLSELCSDDDTESTDTSKAKLLTEWLGLALSNIDISALKKSLWLYSAMGNSGKSVYFEIIRMLLNSKNIINIPIQKLDDRFSGGSLFGKRLNIVPDQSTENVVSSSVFKQATGGDNIGAEIKGKMSFSFRFRGGMMFGCNGLPYISDDSGTHLFERMMIVPCKHTVEAEKQDLDLTKKLEAEKDGIFCIAMEALTRFLKSGKRFTVCTASDEVMKDYRSRSDTLYAYCTEFYELTSDRKDRIRKTDFDSEYYVWCSNNERNGVKKRNITEKMAKLGIQTVKSCGFIYYTGLKRRDFWGVSGQA